MSNFEYIVSSLPFLTPGYRYPDGSGFDGVIGEIRRYLSERDGEVLDFLLRGLDPDRLDADFYAAALTSKDRFIREYFRFDLNLRNAKVRYLNRMLGRPEDQDVMTGEGADGDAVDIDGFRFRGGEFEEDLKVMEILDRKDLLDRERGLDDLVWDKVERLTVFDYFNLDAVLGYVAKLKIVDRWLSLDEETGRELFRRLVSEVKGTFRGVHYDDKQ